MTVPSTAAEQLLSFNHQPHFGPTDMYTGAQPVSIQPVLDELINKSANEFLALVEKQANEEAYLRCLQAGLDRFEPLMLDTEDREHVASTFEQLMDIVAMESSDGKLNTYVYGFDPSSFTQ